MCQVANEAAFALGEGLGSAEDIDTGMVHGLNYPRGILAWADEIGLDHVLSVLDALYAERGEERYRVGPAAAPPGLVRPCWDVRPAPASSTTRADPPRTLRTAYVLARRR